MSLVLPCKLHLLALLGAALPVLSSCLGSSDPPTILDVNGSSDPASPTGLLIEINGDDFRSLPGRVVFVQGANVAEVIPPSEDWSGTALLVNVPSGGASGGFTVPGTVTMSVVTLIGDSNGVDLDLVPTPVFSVENLQWATTTPLPTPLRGLQAVPVPNTSTSAYLIVAGGNDGSANVATVLTNTLAEDGQLGPTWSTTSALPAPRAHHGMVAAHPGNSPVTTGSSFIYVIAGQESHSDTPGGTSTVYVAGVSAADGSAGSWTQTTALPVALVGPAVTLYHGFIYVVGGLRTDGTPSAAVYSVRVNPDGSLGVWKALLNAYPIGISFATALGYGGSLYLLGGDIGTSTDPSLQGGPGTALVHRAPVRSGVLGPWSSTSSTLKERKKHVTWAAFGQLVAAEGVYDGSPASLELERSLVRFDGSLAAWSGITAPGSQIGATVYSASALVSPIYPAATGPRFLLLGGQVFSSAPPGALSSAVYYNTAP